MCVCVCTHTHLTVKNVSFWPSYLAPPLSQRRGPITTGLVVKVLEGSLVRERAVSLCPLWTEPEKSFSLLI